MQLCRTKIPADNATPLRQQQLAQFLMDKARVEASRDTLDRAAEMSFEDVARSAALLSIVAKIRLQLAVCFAAEACAEAVRFVNDVTGALSIRLEQLFERQFRDALVRLQHPSKSSPRHGSARQLQNSCTVQRLLSPVPGFPAMCLAMDGQGVEACLSPSHGDAMQRSVKCSAMATTIQYSHKAESSLGQAGIGEEIA